MELRDIYLETLPEHIAYVKFIFESYEEVGIIRTVDRKKAIIVLLAMDDFLDTARNILDVAQARRAAHGNSTAGRCGR